MNNPAHKNFRRRVPTPDVIARIVKARAEGVTLQECSARFGFVPATISAVVKRASSTVGPRSDHTDPTVFPLRVHDEHAENEA